MSIDTTAATLFVNLMTCSIEWWECYQDVIYREQMSGWCASEANITGLLYFI